MSPAPAYLLDTNLLSETRRKVPHPGVLAFLQSANSDSLYLSVLVVGELHKGVAAKMRIDSTAAKSLATWVAGLESGFADRILGIDTAVARTWGEWSSGRPRPVIDTLMAATAFIHGLTLVTRNERDLHGLPVKLLNPWTS